MLWLWFGLVTAIFFAAYSLLAKRLAKKIEPIHLGFYGIMIGAIISTPFLFAFKDKIIINQNSLIGLTLLAIIIGFSRYFYMNALRHGEIGKTMPLLALSPIITVPFAFFLVGELPTLLGFLGILVAVIGTYFLNISHFSKNDLLKPFKVLIKNKGSRAMIYVILLYGIGAGLDKFVIVNSNVETRLFLSYYFTVVAMAVFLISRYGWKFVRNNLHLFKKNYKALILLAAIHYAMLVFQMIGVSLTVTAYVVTLKRTAALFAVIGAYFFFHEKKDFRNTMIGTVFLIIGVVLLTL